MTDIPTDEAVDEWTRSFVDAIETRFLVSSTEPSPETDPAPGDDEPGEEPPSPETAPPVPAETPAEETPPPDEEQPDEGEAPDAEHGQSTPAFTLSGVDYTAEQIAQAVQIRDWFERLDPNTVQGIDAYVSGAYRLVPVQEPPPGAAQPATPPPPHPTTEDEGEWLDPRAQQEINQLRSQIDELQQTFKANLAPVVETQQQADYNQRLTAINEAHAEFQSKYGLPDEAMQALEATIAEGQILPGLANRYGNLRSGMNAALEMAFWSTPTYRDPYVRSAQTSQEAERVQEDAATVRKQHLTALSGSGGSVPRREPVPSTPEDRHAAMVNEIAAAMNGSGQIE